MRHVSVVRPRTPNTDQPAPCQHNGVVVDPKFFRWMVPGERRFAVWATKRILMVQHGDSRQLVAGAYTVLASTWTSLGGIVLMGGLATYVFTKAGALASALLTAGCALVATGFLRQVQSRNARKRGRSLGVSATLLRD
jgi:hypothetical protein